MAARPSRPCMRAGPLNPPPLMPRQCPPSGSTSLCHRWPSANRRSPSRGWTPAAPPGGGGAAAIARGRWQSAVPADTGDVLSGCDIPAAARATLARPPARTAEAARRGARSARSSRPPRLPGRMPPWGGCDARRWRHVLLQTLRLVEDVHHHDSDACTRASRFGARATRRPTQPPAEHRSPRSAAFAAPRAPPSAAVRRPPTCSSCRGRGAQRPWRLRRSASAGRGAAGARHSPQRASIWPTRGLDLCRRSARATRESGGGASGLRRDQRARGVPQRAWRASAAARGGAARRPADRMRIKQTTKGRGRAFGVAGLLRSDQPAGVRLDQALRDAPTPGARVAWLVPSCSGGGRAAGASSWCGKEDYFRRSHS
eukprot:31121-Chlamydomonas_euryale.AAC.4